MYGSYWWFSFFKSQIHNFFPAFAFFFFFFCQKLSIQIDENALHEILNEVDLNKNGQVELDEFLQVQRASLESALHQHG